MESFIWVTFPNHYSITIIKYSIASKLEDTAYPCSSHSRNPLLVWLQLWFSFTVYVRPQEICVTPFPRLRCCLPMTIYCQKKELLHYKSILIFIISGRNLLTSFETWSQLREPIAEQEKTCRAKLEQWQTQKRTKTSVASQDPEGHEGSKILYCIHYKATPNCGEFQRWGQKRTSTAYFWKGDCS